MVNHLLTSKSNKRQGWRFASVRATADPPTYSAVPGAGLPPGALNQFINRILIDRTNSQNVWVAYGGSGGPRLYFSNNGGTSFTSVNGLPQVAIFALAQHPVNAQWLYAGTLVGLFASQNLGGAWSASNEGPANVIVRDLNWLIGV